MFELREYMASWHRPKRESLSYTTNMMTSNSFYKSASLDFDLTIQTRNLFADEYTLLLHLSTPLGSFQNILLDLI